MHGEKTKLTEHHLVLNVTSFTTATNCKLQLYCVPSFCYS